MVWVSVVWVALRCGGLVKGCGVVAVLLGGLWLLVCKACRMWQRLKARRGCYRVGLFALLSLSDCLPFVFVPIDCQNEKRKKGNPSPLLPYSVGVSVSVEVGNGCAVSRSIDCRQNFNGVKPCAAIIFLSCSACSAFCVIDIVKFFSLLRS